MPSQNSSDDGFPALKGHMGQLNARDGLEHLQDKVRLRPDTHGADADFSGVLFSIVNKFAQTFSRAHPI